jgi:hypothetical protein
VAARRDGAAERLCHTSAGVCECLGPNPDDFRVILGHEGSKVAERVLASQPARAQGLRSSACSSALAAREFSIQSLSANKHKIEEEISSRGLGHGQILTIASGEHIPRHTLST